jgi:hypothetical protein
VATPLVAAATPGQCATWHVPGRDAYHVRPIHTVFTRAGGHIILESGKATQGQPTKWCGATIPQCEGTPGKVRRTDVSFNDGRFWIRCGPFRAKGTDNLDSKFHATSRSPGWTMRACGSDLGHSHFSLYPLVLGPQKELAPGRPSPRAADSSSSPVARLRSQSSRACATCTVPPRERPARRPDHRGNHDPGQHEAPTSWIQEVGAYSARARPCLKALPGPRQRRYWTTTFSAWGPLGPCVTSYATLSFSRSSL